MSCSYLVSCLRVFAAEACDLCLPALWGLGLRVFNAFSEASSSHVKEWMPGRQRRGLETKVTWQNSSRCTCSPKPYTLDGWQHPKTLHSELAQQQRAEWCWAGDARMIRDTLQRRLLWIAPAPQPFKFLGVTLGFLLCVTSQQRLLCSAFLRAHPGPAWH